jgi:hypothetical protein
MAEYPNGIDSKDVHDEWAYIQVSVFVSSPLAVCWPYCVAIVLMCKVATGVDYSHGSAWTTFFAGALNYQVAHHLFPGVSQVGLCRGFLVRSPYRTHVTLSFRTTVPLPSDCANHQRCVQRVRTAVPGSAVFLECVQTALGSLEGDGRSWPRAAHGLTAWALLWMVVLSKLSNKLHSFACNGPIVDLPAGKVDLTPYTR